MFADIHRRVGHKLTSPTPRKGKIDGINFSEILYADDTLLVLQDDKSASLLLQEIEIESAYYNMKLNEDKCEVISMNADSKVTFGNGKVMQEVEQSTYLGGILHKKVNPMVAIRKRISATLPIVSKLNIFWTEADCSTKCKLNVYNAVVISKLIYGLETLQFTEAQGKHLDTFQQIGLRRILGIPPTYIDRSHTNEEVFKIANTAKGCDEDKKKTKIIPITETIQKRKITLLGHVIRAGNRDKNDPMYQVTFESKDLAPKMTAYRRVGRPRNKWHQDTMEQAWAKIHHNGSHIPKYTGNEKQRQILQKSAIDRTYPFEQSKNERLKKKQ